MITSVYVLLIALVFKGYTFGLAIGHLVLYFIFVVVVVVQSAMQASAVKKAEESGLGHRNTLRSAATTQKGADLVKMVEKRREELSSSMSKKLPPSDILEVDNPAYLS
jgi:hypothetical protein